MNNYFANRLIDYLDSECGDYDLSYTYEWCEDSQNCEVEIKRNDHTQFTKCLNFKYDKENDDLKIELCEDSFYITREFDQTVKYFWMLISPTIFPEA